MTARQNIRFGLEIRKIDSAEADRRVEEAVQLVQLGQFASKKPNEMSGGQQQRVALARALVVNPDCLLLDEPLSNLDAKLRLEMRSEIRRICRASGLTGIYVTHDQKEALSIADRMAVLNYGKIEQIGKPRDLYLRPGNRFVANFMGETNFIEGRLTDRQNDHAVIRTAIGDLTSTVIPSSAQIGDAVTVSIRPETVQVGTTGSPALNSFNAAIHDTVYLGEVAQHIVRIEGQSSLDLRAFELNPKFVARDGAVEQARAWIDPSDIVVLPAENAA
jgi:iron(III) transport system ATP-binding protein